MKASESERAAAGSGLPRRQAWLLAALLVLANLPLFCGRPPADLVFFPQRVAEGQWWRLLTFPLAHVSWYHLALDGAAFLQLLAALGDLGAGRRLLIVVAGAAGSLLLPLAVPSPIREVGVCGLSGVDHGLMAVAGVRMLGAPARRERREGAWMLAAVTVKAIVEACSGHILLESLHFGALGVPVAACHLGGVLGALAALGASAALAPRAQRRRAPARSVAVPA